MLTMILLHVNFAANTRVVEQYPLKIRVNSDLPEANHVNIWLWLTFVQPKLLLLLKMNSFNRPIETLT